MSSLEHRVAVLESQMRAIGAAASTTPDPPFAWLEATLYRPRPTPLMPGLDRLSVLYGSDLWPRAMRDHSEPHEETIRERAREFRGRDRVCLDIEHWPTNDPDRPERTTASLAKLLQVLAWWREENPGTRIGYYGIVPEVSPNEARDGAGGWRMETVRRRNDALTSLVDAVDDLYPVLYTIVEPRERDLFNRYLGVKIGEGRRVAQGKPIIPFVWPDYHRGLVPKFAGQQLPADWWEEQIALIREHADGVVVWSEPGTAFEADAPWVGVLQRYIHNESN